MTKVVNDLYDYGLSIVQDTDLFKFSLDSILLAEFVSLRLSDKVILDFCTGNAAIPLILSTKTKKKITGIELQDTIYSYAVESVKLNHLENQINLIHDDVKNVQNYIKEESADVIICNPPYFKVPASHKLINTVYEKAIARHELCLDLETLIQLTSRTLKRNGQFFLVHQATRFTEILFLMKKYHIAVKKVNFIYSNPEKDAIMVLIQGLKDGKEGLKIGKPIIVNRAKTYQNIFK